MRDGNVTLYKRERSKRWQMCFRLFDKKWHRVSTGYEDLEYAKKVEPMQPDALIAVNNEAGGHAGKIAPRDLITTLCKHTHLPIISAGGVGNGAQMKKMMDYGACGISIGSPFIASNESPVSNDYKMACVNYGAKDIVMTTRLSGTPCTVINTEYVKKIGTDQNWVEKFLNSNKKIKSKNEGNNTISQSQVPCTPERMF